MTLFGHSVSQRRTAQTEAGYTFRLHLQDWMSIFSIIKNRHSPPSLSSMSALSSFFFFKFAPPYCYSTPFSTLCVSKCTQWLCIYLIIGSVISTMLLFADSLWSRDETKHSIFPLYFCRLLI